MNRCALLLISFLSYFDLIVSLYDNNQSSEWHFFYKITIYNANSPMLPYNKIKNTLKELNVIMDNPALKLHSILSEAYNTVYSNDKYSSAWAKIFNVDENDRIALMRNISGILNLYNETLNLVEQNERLNTENNKKFLLKIQNAIFTINFEGNMIKFMDSLDEETLTALFFIGEIIYYQYDLNDSKIDSEKVDEILFEINDLIHSIAESILPKDVQDILINNLILIKDALYRYRFLGEKELRKALEQTIGSIAINKSIIDENQDDNIYPRFGDVIGKTSSLITIGTAIKDYLLPLFEKLPIK